MPPRSKPGTREYLTDTLTLRAENDARDKAAGRKPLGKPASQSTREERAAYWAQFPDRPVIQDFPVGPAYAPKPTPNRDQETEEALDHDQN